MLSRRLTRVAGVGGGVALLALLYFVAGRLSWLLVTPPGYALGLWPGTGIALAALLVFGRWLWPGVVLGSFLISFSAVLGPASAPVLLAATVAFGIAVGAGAQAVLGSTLARGLVRRDPGLLHLRNVVGLLVLGGPVACLVNSTWGMGVLLAGRLIEADELGFSWLTWWIADSVGVLIFAPLAWSWVGKPRALWSKRSWVITIPLALTLGAVMLAAVFVSRQEQAARELEFVKSGELMGDSLERHIVRYLEIVYGIQSYFASSSEVSRQQFQTFVHRILERVPGIQALSWNPRIRRAERARYEAAAHRDGLPDFRITERDAGGRLVPAGKRSEYIAVYYIEPHAANASALGYDVYSEATRQEALDQARDTGTAVATARITLVQETGSQAGVLVFVPIYRSGRVPASVTDRRADLRGYAVGVFRLGDVLRNAFGALGTTDLEASLYDDSAEDDSRPLAVYRADRRGLATVGTTPGLRSVAGGLTFSKRYDVAGRTWRFDLIPDRHYLVARRPWATWGLLTGGLSFTALLGLFLVALTGRRILDQDRARELARVNASLSDEVAQRLQAERALHVEKERAEVTLHSIGDAVITTNASGEVEYLNPIAEQLTEWNLEEARGRPLASVFRIINEETREPAADPVQRCRQGERIIGLANHTVLISRSGREYAIEDSAAPIRDHRGGVLGVVLVFKDVSEARRMAREAVHQATHDSLTGLVNRREFGRRLEQALASSKRHGSRHALCYLDLDQFKLVNDTSGHLAGDELLKHVANLLSRGVRQRDTLARLGGDEFGLLLHNCPLDKAVEIAETLTLRVRDYRFVWEGRVFDIGVSIGLVPIAGQVEMAETLLSHADVACYTAKSGGRNRVYVYRADSSGSDPSHREILRAADVGSAIDRNHFEVYQQPIWSLRDDPPRIARHELLLRMLDEQGNLVLPGSFVPVAERFGIMERVDRWLVQTAFRAHGRLFRGVDCPPISINLSGNLLGDANLLAFLREEFRAHGVNPEAICFEITETAAIRNISAAADLVQAVRDMGAKFALDDFGSGLSSFAYLKSLPVDYLKIDGSLVRGAAEDTNDRAMVEAINQLAHRLGIKTVAEHVETPECLRVVREIGVNYAQGFVLAAPERVPPEAWR